jgi:hypothetical protein
VERVEGAVVDGGHIQQVLPGQQVQVRVLPADDVGRRALRVGRAQGHLAEVLPGAQGGAVEGGLPPPVEADPALGDEVEPLDSAAGRERRLFLCEAADEVGVHGARGCLVGKLPDDVVREAGQEPDVWKDLAEAADPRVEQHLLECLSVSRLLLLLFLSNFLALLLLGLMRRVFVKGTVQHSFLNGFGAQKTVLVNFMSCSATYPRCGGSSFIFENWPII